MSLEDDLLRFMPIAVLLCALQIGPVMTVQVLEYPVLILEASILCSFGRLRRCVVYGCQASGLLLT